MASEAEEVPDVFEEDARMPESSAMKRTIVRLLHRFVQQDDEGDGEFHKRQNQAIHQFTDQMAHARGKGRAAFYPEAGQRQFQYFHLANDAALETATNDLVLQYENYHPTAGRNKKPRRGAWDAGPRAHATHKYVETLERLLKAEDERLKAFAAVKVDNLSLNKAYQDSPLYQSFQKAGQLKKKGTLGEFRVGGPYEFAVKMSEYHKPGVDQDKFTEEYVTKAAEQAGLTGEEMSRILVQTGHRRHKLKSATAKREISLLKREKEYAAYTHGLEHEQFTSKFKHYNFGKYFVSELGRRYHLKEVLRKIYLEGAGASDRPEVYSAAQPSAAQPEVEDASPRVRPKRRRPEPAEELMSSEANLDDMEQRLSDNVLLHRPRRKRGRQTEMREAY